jgi:hypothetical protein
MVAIVAAEDVSRFQALVDEPTFVVGVVTPTEGVTLS